MLSRVLAVALLAAAGAAVAHHSQGMFVETPVWVTGVVVRYQPTDPHVMVDKAAEAFHAAGLHRRGEPRAHCPLLLTAPEA